MFSVAKRVTERAVPLPERQTRREGLSESLRKWLRKSIMIAMMRFEDMLHLFPFGTLGQGNCRTTFQRFQIFFIGKLSELEKSCFRVKTRLKRGTSHEPKLVMSKSCCSRSFALDQALGSKAHSLILL